MNYSFLVHLALLAVFLLVFASGCSPEASVVGNYHIEQDGAGFGPGAEKITLDLHADKSFAVQAGPKVTMLDGTWTYDPATKLLTFSKGQGALVVSYRADGMKLIPQQDGKDVTGWRWVR